MAKENLKNPMLWIDENEQVEVNKLRPGALPTFNTTNAGGGSGSGGSAGGTSGTAGGSGTSDYYSQLMAAIDAQKQAAKDAQYAALAAQLNRGLNDYDAQLKSLDPVYQNYRNQSEVERYKAQRSLRESLANRGALDSGVGRQEMLNLDTNYGNNLNAINMQYQAEVDAINRAKQALKDEAEFQKIQIGSNLDNTGLQEKINLLKDQISKQSATSRNAASGVVSKATNSGGQTVSTKTSSSPYQTGTGAYTYDMMIKKQGASNDATKAASLISQGYTNGTLTEDDVKTLAARYGINVK